jgi:hypothetical protein
MKRYSAMLLFQYRAEFSSGKSNIMRTCEERLIVLSARNAKSALSKAKAHGNKAEFDGENEDGDPVYFEFVGVRDLLEIGAECEADEVWYDIFTRKQPSERKDKFIPQEQDLMAIKLEQN